MRILLENSRTATKEADTGSISLTLRQILPESSSTNSSSSSSRLPFNQESFFLKMFLQFPNNRAPKNGDAFKMPLWSAQSTSKAAFGQTALFQPSFVNPSTTHPSHAVNKTTEKNSKYLNSTKAFGENYFDALDIQSQSDEAPKNGNTSFSALFIFAKLMVNFRQTAQGGQSF